MHQDMFFHPLQQDSLLTADILLIPSNLISITTQKEDEPQQCKPAYLQQLKSFNAPLFVSQQVLKHVLSAAMTKNQDTFLPQKI